MFWREYVERTAPWRLVHFHADGSGGTFQCRATVTRDGKEQKLIGEGNGPIAAFVHGLKDSLGVEMDVVDYHEHSLTAGADAQAVAYVETVGPDNRTRWGVGVHPSILTASLHAVLSALNGRV